MPGAPRAYCPHGEQPLAVRLEALRGLGSLTPQQRGYCFEDLLRDALGAEKLQPRASYKLDGEQIDGSFVLDGRVFLFEAKWVADPVPASTLYAFQGKVAGKLVGTVGFFIAMSGFSEDAPDTLAYGKDLSVLLVTGEDLQQVVCGGGSFTDMFRQKLRAAVEEGVTLAPYAETLVTAKRVEATTATVTRRGTVVVVEGRRDAAIVTRLGNRYLKAIGSSAELVVTEAGGPVNATRVAAALAGSRVEDRRVVLLVDADAASLAALERERQRDLGAPSVEVIAVAPSLEEGWLGLTPERLRRADVGRRVRDAAERLDVRELLREPTFRRFAELISEA